MLTLKLANSYSVCVAFNNTGLLINKVVGWNDEDDLFSCLSNILIVE